MELAKKAWQSSTPDTRITILEAQGLIAYDIYLVNWVFNFPNIPTDAVENWLMGLSKRLEDQSSQGIFGGAAEMTPLTILQSDAIFAMCGLMTAVNTQGGLALIASRPIPFTKPYRVPYASMVISASGTVEVQGACEVYYESVRVSPREMAFLRKDTEVIRTT